jgi:acyl-CoA synthetase (AMP-forming)/AMP-acid ligase II
MIELIQRASKHVDRQAIFSNENSYLYKDLLKRSSQIASKLLNGKLDLNGDRIAFIIDPSFEYVADTVGNLESRRSCCSSVY